MVVGAGAAGVGAARALAAANVSALVVEASARVGGRARTATIDGLALDLGCGWLHSGDRNPWVAIAEAQGFGIARKRAAWMDEWRGLGFPKPDRCDADAAYDAWMRRMADAPPASDRASDALVPGGRWNAWLEMLSGAINGAVLERVSIADYLAYDRAASDCNWRVREGYGTLVAASLPAIPVRLGTPVTAIDTTGRLVAIETRAGMLRARVAIVTVSTAVLADIAFRPGLDTHLHAAAQLPLGLANKVYLAIDGPAPFEPETHLTGDRFRSVAGSHYIRPLGAPVIESYYGGAGAQAIEREGPAAAFAQAIDEIAALAGSDVRRCLRPLAATAWARETHVRGSYSHALPGCAGARRILATPADRLLLAGEATHATDFSTAHGALESGTRAAAEALAVLARGR